MHSSTVTKNMGWFSGVVRSPQALLICLRGRERTRGWGQSYNIVSWWWISGCGYMFLILKLLVGPLRWSFCLVPTPRPGYEAKLSYIIFMKTVPACWFLMPICWLSFSNCFQSRTVRGVSQRESNHHRQTRINCAPIEPPSPPQGWCKYSASAAALSKSADVCNRLVNIVKPRPPIA